MRLFAGVFPPAEARGHLEAQLVPIRARSGLRRWQPPERWHITVAFLGDVEPERIAGIEAGVSAACAASSPLRVRLTGAGSFGTGRGSGALWIGVADADAGAGTVRAQRAEWVGPTERPGAHEPAERVGAVSLAGLARRVGVATASGNGRAFRPHITIARWRAPERPTGQVLGTLRAYRGPVWTITEVVLVRSHLGAEPTYEWLSAWPLRPG